MKKILAYVCAAALMLGTVQIPHTKTYAITVVSDAQTAVEKNMELFLDKLENADVDENFTKDDLENLLFGACEYSTNDFVGTGFFVDNFKLVSPTEKEAGYMSAVISIFIDDAEEALEVKKEFSALGNGIGKGSVSTDDGNGSKDEVSGGDDKNTSSEDAASAKKNIAEAKKAINAAIWEFDVSNDTTANDILNMAKEAVGNSSGVTVTLDKLNFKLIKASTTVEGSLSATISLACGSVTDAVPIGKTVPKVVNEESIKIEEDRKNMSNAIEAMAFTNRTTKEEMLEAALKNVKNGSKAVWKSFDKKNATFKENGSIIGYLTITLGGEVREMRIQKTIPMLIRNIPTDKISVNKEEWEILRITNVERAKQGLFLLTMIDDLQRACDIREVELAESFSHTRPNGEAPFTAIENFKYAKAGENIYKCEAKSIAVSGERAMNSWMNSDGHRANILTSTYDYIGAGAYDNEKLGTALQLFAGVSYPLVSAVTASGKTDYIDEDEMQKDYLICTASNGLVSYVPLDIEYMTKTDAGYTLELRITDPIVLTTGGKSSNSSNSSKTEEKTNENAQAENVGTFTDVKSDAYYANAVKWAIERNITKGTSDTTFSPDDTCTRAQILSFLWRAVGSPKATIENPFADLKTSDYFYDAALWAYQKGMVSGGNFEGSTPCTRASTVVYLWKNANAPSSKYSGNFNDVSDGDSFAEAVSWAIESGVTAGTSDTTFSPETVCSRGQIVTFLNRAIK